MHSSIPHKEDLDTFPVKQAIQAVTIYLEGLADMAASNWLTSMVENNP